MYHSAVGPIGAAPARGPKRESPDEPWLLFLHQLPAKPGYQRVRLWRRLQRIGAVQIKGSVWALPSGPEALEDFRWLLAEIRESGGDALICEATFVAGLKDDVARALATRAAEGEGRRSTGARPHTTIDLRPDAEEAERPRGSAWVTRAGVKVDRIGSAWLVKRQIDPTATFKLVADPRYVPGPGEIRFDMFDGEYTHRGDACTFEVLASTFVPGDAAVAAMAEIVHDIDLKEQRFARPETEGFRTLLLEGVCRADVPDADRLERGFALFDALWSALASRERST